MQNLEKYRDVRAGQPLFDKYLPYAIAFDMEKTWIRRFSNVSTTPVPTWYFPTYYGGHYGRGYRPGTPIGDNLPSAGDVLPGDIARAGGGMSLDTMAGDMSGGLESMASGLSNMLESASSTLTSQPQSSSSGGSWSGGGSLGGGSIGGGGSRGFG